MFEDVKQSHKCLWLGFCRFRMYIGYEGFVRNPNFYTKEMCEAMDYLDYEGRIKLGDVINTLRILVDNFYDNKVPGASIPRLNLPDDLSSGEKQILLAEYKSQYGEIVRQQCHTVAELRKQIYDLMTELCRYSAFHPDFCPEVLALRKLLEDRAQDLVEKERAARQLQEEQSMKERIERSQDELRKREEDAVNRGIEDYVNRLTGYQTAVLRKLCREAVLAGLYQLCLEHPEYRRSLNYSAKVEHVQHTFPKWLADVWLIGPAFKQREFIDLSPSDAKEMAKRVACMREILAKETVDEAVSLMIEKGLVEGPGFDILSMVHRSLEGVIWGINYNDREHVKCRSVVEIVSEWSEEYIQAVPTRSLLVDALSSQTVIEEPADEESADDALLDLEEYFDSEE